MSHLTEIVEITGAREKEEKEKEVGRWAGGGVSALQSPQGSPFPCCRPSLGTAFCVTLSPWLTSSLTVTTFRTL